MGVAIAPHNSGSPEGKLPYVQSKKSLHTHVHTANKHGINWTWYHGAVLLRQFIQLHLFRLIKICCGSFASGRKRILNWLFQRLRCCYYIMPLVRPRPSVRSLAAFIRAPSSTFSTPQFKFYLKLGPNMQGVVHKWRPIFCLFLTYLSIFNFFLL